MSQATWISMSARAATSPRSRGWAIAGPGYDTAWFLAPPLASLILGVVLWTSGATGRTVDIGGRTFPLVGLLLGATIHAHLVIVFVRSHGNASIRRRHPVRFFAVPALLWIAVMSSRWLLVAAGVLAVFWDVYHSAMQTFGLGRIYDQRAGNDLDRGRSLDRGLNLLLYVGPIVGGATLLDHVGTLRDFDAIGSHLFSEVPATMASWQGTMAWLVLAGGAAFLLVYLGVHARWCRAGYRISKAKLFLYVSTALCSIWAWGFNTWGEAFFVMNVFHAVQYFGIVWWAERDRLVRGLRLDRVRGGIALAWLLFVGGAAAYGLMTQTLTGVTWFFALTHVVALMHFWYDGFIWSVRRGQVGEGAAAGR